MTGLRRSISGAVLSLLWLVACSGATSSPALGTPEQASSSIPLVQSIGLSRQASSHSGNDSLAIVSTDAPHQPASNAYPHQLNCPELNSAMLSPDDQFRAAIANRNRACALIDILILLTRASAPRKAMAAGRSP